MINWHDLWFWPVNLNTYGRYSKTTDRPPAAEHSPAGVSLHDAREDGEVDGGNCQLHPGEAEDHLQPVGESLD